MGKQLVVHGNRVIAHGEDCFFLLGDSVISTETGKIYHDTTIVEYTAECPTDIDAVGYEYHAGVFMPIAPIGSESVKWEELDDAYSEGVNSAYDE